MLFAGLAEGLEPAIQGFASGVVGRTMNASLFTFMSMLDTVAELLGGPLMAAAYRIRDANGLPAGYCFLLSAVSNVDELDGAPNGKQVLFLLLWLASCWVQLPGEAHESSDVQS